MTGDVALCEHCRSPYVLRRRRLAQRFCSTPCRYAFWGQLGRSAARLRDAIVQEIAFLEGRVASLKSDLAEIGSRPMQGNDTSLLGKEIDLSDRTRE
jgi:hypothetical protein